MATGAGLAPYLAIHDLAGCAAARAASTKERSCESIEAKGGVRSTMEPDFCTTSLKCPRYQHEGLLYRVRTLPPVFQAAGASRRLRLVRHHNFVQCGQIGSYSKSMKLDLASCRASYSAFRSRLLSCASSSNPMKMQESWVLGVYSFATSASTGRMVSSFT